MRSSVSAYPSIGASCTGLAKRARGAAGFTLVEVLAACLVLAIGIVATFTMLDSAGRAASANNARVGASNLAREIAEYARGTDYDSLQPATVVGALRAHSRITGVSDWKIQRRGVTYTVQASVCTFDDPKDGLAAADPPNACTPKAAAVAGAPAEVNPDDFRRVTVTLLWSDRQGAHRLTQAALVVNPSGGLGPRITSFPEPAAQITSGTSVSWTAALNPVTTTAADALHWIVDDGVSQGDVSGSGATTWAFTWDLGTLGTAPFTMDGTYQVSAQAFDSRGVPGEARSVTVHVNRRIPYAPASLKLGRNEQHGGIVDLDWSRNLERDVIGYRVWRVGLLGARTQICTDTGLDYTVRTSCVDTNPNGLVLPVGIAQLRRRRGGSHRPQGGFEQHPQRRRDRRRSCRPSRRARTRPSPTRRRSSTACRSSRGPRRRSTRRRASVRSASTASTATEARASPTATT